jgi:hypothetical protein
MEEQQDIRVVVREVIEDFFKGEHAQERTQRESLEQRVNELVAENQKAQAKAEEADRSAAVRAELQRLGVAKLDLAYKAIKDEIHRSEDGKLISQNGADLREHVLQFVNENPELLPARLTGGSGASAGQRNTPGDSRVDLDRIRPGMNPEELERVRQEIARVASQTLRGL